MFQTVKQSNGVVTFTWSAIRGTNLPGAISYQLDFDQLEQFGQSAGRDEWHLECIRRDD